MAIINSSLYELQEVFEGVHNFAGGGDTFKVALYTAARASMPAQQRTLLATR